MHKNIFIIALVILLGTVTSCERNPLQSDNNGGGGGGTTQSLVRNKWLIDSAVYTVFIGGQNLGTQSQPYGAGEYFDFYTSNKVARNIEGIVDTATYQNFNDNYVVMPNPLFPTDTFNVLKLNNSEFRMGNLVSVDTFGAQYDIDFVIFMHK